MTKSSFRNNLVPTFLFLLLGWSIPAFALLQINQVILVDDFDSQRGPSAGGGKQALHFVTGDNAFGKAGTSLALDYDVNESGSFASFQAKLSVPLTDMRYLSFWMKTGEKAQEIPLEFSVELREDKNGDRKFVFGVDTVERISASHFVAGTDPQGWQKVVIPLSRFHRIRRWGQVLEISLFFESKRRLEKGGVLLDSLLFGSSYPDEMKGTEISMQNRVSSFKIDNQLASPEMKLKMKLKPRPIPLALTLTFVDPYLEEIRFEESRDGGSTWRRIQSFYDHSTGGVYPSEVHWARRRDIPFKEGLLIRVVGVNLFGGETELAGPYHTRFG